MGGGNGWGCGGDGLRLLLLLRSAERRGVFAAGRAGVLAVAPSEGADADATIEERTAEEFLAGFEVRAGRFSAARVVWIA